jgi:hypothetical protein
MHNTLQEIRPVAEALPGVVEIAFHEFDTHSFHAGSLVYIAGFVAWRTAWKI